MLTAFIRLLSIDRLELCRLGKNPIVPRKFNDYFICQEMATALYFGYLLRWQVPINATSFAHRPSGE